MDESLSEVFGHDTTEYQRYARAADLDTAGMNMNGTPHAEVIEGLIRGKDRAIALLERAIQSFEEKIAEEEHGPDHLARERRADTRGIKELFLVNNVANPRPTLTRYTYPMPGDENKVFPKSAV